MSTIGIVNGTELGEALVARLCADGRRVISGVDAGAMKRIGAEARLVLLDGHQAELPALVARLGEHLDPNHLVVHTVNGLGAGGGVSALVQAESSVRRTGVLGGPLLVSALRKGTPTAAVIASRHPEVVDEFAELLSTPRLRVYRSRDPIGIELAASLAELAVLGCGIADALLLGAPARALLVVRAVRELGRLVEANGGDPLTATGLGGLGDILVRGADASAAAYRVGRALALGEVADQAALEELRATAALLVSLNPGERVSAHLFHGLGALLAGKATATELLDRLMSMRVLDE